MTTTGASYADVEIELDGAGFEGCSFQRCRLVYRGAAPTLLVDNVFEDCEFALEDAARLTLRYVKGMADSSDGFLIMFLKSLDLDPARLARLAGGGQSGA